MPSGEHTKVEYFIEEWDDRQNRWVQPRGDAPDEYSEYEHLLLESLRHWAKPRAKYDRWRGRRYRLMRKTTFVSCTEVSKHQITIQGLSP